MEKLLCNFAIGESGVVCGVRGEGRVRRRLFDMGVTPGAEVTLVKKAPLGDPLEVTLRGYQLTLRRTEAECVATKSANPQVKTDNAEPVSAGLISSDNAEITDKSAEPSSAETAANSTKEQREGKR